MIGIKTLSRLDRVSVSLVVALLLSFLAVTANSSPSAIPERFLDRVRGANPNYSSTVNQAIPDCTNLQAYDDSAAGVPTVPWDKCLVKGTACVQCPVIRNYQLNNVASNPGVFTTPTGVSCNGGDNPNGSSGTCGTLPTGGFGCDLVNKYNCDQYAFNYGAEPAGGP